MSDSTLEHQIAPYSQGLARLVKVDQALYADKPESSLPLHNTGTFWVTEDPKEIGGDFEFFRNDQHWLYKINVPSDHENDSANSLDITPTTWVLYHEDDGGRREKIAEGTLSQVSR